MRRRFLATALCTLALAATVTTAARASETAAFEPVTDFGANPGNLQMYQYRPSDNPGRPLVVALHGCTQDAALYHENAGWQKYADAWDFNVVYPQQPSGNNVQQCFNWFDAADTARGDGEAASIASMIDHARTQYDVDPSRVYVTGLSAGGAMSAVMLAAYPDLFDAGSVVAGVPYRCATTVAEAYGCMSPGSDRTPQQWGDLVRAAHPDHSGDRPRVAIWHGDADNTVAPLNSAESRDQWTDVAGIAPEPTETVDLPGTSLEKYGSDQVRRYTVAGMDHGTPVDPVDAEDQCGTAGEHFLDTICSTYHDAIYFGLSA